MGKINPTSFISFFSFGHGCVHPFEMAKTLAFYGLTCLPCTEIMSTASLTNAIKAAKVHNLTLLYGQKIPIDRNFFWIYPDDENSFAWLNKLCSEILAGPQFTAPDKWPEDNVFALLKASPPQGHGRIIFSGNESQQLLKLFLNSNWKCFIKIPDCLSISEKNKVLDLAQKFSLAPIAAPEIIVSKSPDKETLRLLKAIHGGGLLDEFTAEEPLGPQDISQMAWKEELFPSAYENNVVFCKQPSWVPTLGRLAMPVFMESRLNANKLLREISMNGLAEKYPVVSNKILERFEYELKSIIELGFTDYFLTVHEITCKAKELGVRVLGRGSAANSLISYALDFTQVDPVKYDLYFERFLNSHRKSPPDVDLDFSWKIRNQIYDFLRERWGAERVALISTHISFNGRGAIRETGKALGVCSEELNYLSSLIGYNSLRDYLKDPQKYSRFKPDLARVMQNKRLLTLAASIEGIPTHFSIHAGGVVIAPKSLYNFTITQPSSKVLPITQTEMNSCEELGLVKLDLLSQRALGVYADVCRELQRHNKAVVPKDPEFIERDLKVVEALSCGATLGVFYIESPGMRGLLGKLQCKTFSELIAASSIIRPGVAESGMMQEYIKRHLKTSSWKPLHPLLSDILSETYGIMVYQEDVMKVAHKIAGFSLSDADVLRRAMSGKERSTNQMQEARQRFLNGAAQNGIDENISSEIWRQISSFCGYAFCKAHSASYAVLSLQLLWMKCHFPGIFMAAVINNRGGFYGTQAYISEAKRLGLKILPPDVTTSVEDFVANDEILQTGLSFIGNLKATTISRILMERARQPFAGIEDFLVRAKPSAGEWENLVDSGSLSSFGSQAYCRWKQKLMNQSALFSEDSFGIPEKIKENETLHKLIENELKAMGFAASGHPIELFNWSEKTIFSRDLIRFTDKNVCISGLLIAAKSVTTSKGEKMKFLTLEDKFGISEVVFFPNAWKKNSISLDKACAMVVSGVVKSDAGQLVIHGQKLRKL